MSDEEPTAAPTIFAEHKVLCKTQWAGLTKRLRLSVAVCNFRHPSANGLLSPELAAQLLCIMHWGGGGVRCLRMGSTKASKLSGD